MCKVLNVSEAGYYQWLSHQGRPYKYQDLLAQILKTRADHPDYGAYRIYLICNFSTVIPEVII
jgi:hypothetical protein